MSPEPSMNDEAEMQGNPHYASYPTIEHAWIYIAVDMRHMRFSKVGLTKKDAPGDRIREGRTYNPFLTLFTTYNLALGAKKISQQELSDFEAYIHSKRVYGFGDPKKHIDSLRESEWFEMLPWQAEEHVDWMIAKRGFTAGGEPLYEDGDNPNNYKGLSIQAMRMIKTVHRPKPAELRYRVMQAGYDPNYIRDYLSYLDHFHTPDHPGQIWV